MALANHASSRRAQFSEGLLKTVDHSLLTNAKPLSGVVGFLVGLAIFGVDLMLECTGVGQNVLPDATGEGELGVCVDVHLEHTVRNGFRNLVGFGARATVKDQVQGIGARAVGVLNQGLAVLQDLRAQLYVARFVHAMDVSKRGRDREMTQRCKPLEGVQHFAGLRVCIEQPVLQLRPVGMER